MADVLLIRPDDHLVLGVRWRDFAVSGSGPAARLTAQAPARLILLLPPQHVGEESSPPGSVGPLQPAGAGQTVPTWRGVLSGPTRLAFDFPAGTQIPLTVEGVLAAVLNRPLVTSTGVPAEDQSAIELPWRLVIAPRGRSTAEAVPVHVTRPTPVDGGGLWRTRLIDPAAAAPLLDADLTLRVVDQPTAGAADPVFTAGNTIPLAGGDRLRLFTETANQPARLRRLELSAIGGSIDATATWPNFAWEHRATLGRDMHVRTLAKGVLYPLGHRAEYLKVSERIYDPTAGGAAVLRTMFVITVVEPVRHAPGAGPVARGCPLGDIEITTTVFTDLVEPQRQFTTLPVVGSMGTHFWPTTRSGAKVRFPIACTVSTGVVRMDLPLLFVFDLRPTVDSLASPVLAQRLADDYGEAAVSIAPSNIDLTPGAAASPLAPGVPPALPAPGSIHEVRALKLAGARIADGLDLADGYRSKLTELEIGLPALRALRGDDARTTVAFTRKYLQNAAEDVVLEMPQANAVPIDFSKAADRSGGLLAPSYLTNAISRTTGPIDRFALPDPATGFIDPARLFPSDSATLLGFPLKTLLTQLKLPPEITFTPRPGAAPEVRMRWTGVKLTSAGPFRATPTTALDLTITTAQGAPDITCVVRNFTLELPPGSKAVLQLSFATMTFTQRDGASPRLEVTGVEFDFLGDLTLVKKLATSIDLGTAGKLIDVRPSGLTVRYALPIPSVSTGAFSIRNMAFTAGIEVPFDGRPVAVRIGFASRNSPFQLGVLMFGGGGYLELELDRSGIRRFEAALEFGAFVAVDFLIAHGEVHALGGVRFVLESSGAVTVAGYLRIGGSVSVLGLVSVSIELCLTLTYTSARNALVGRATLVIEIDLTLWSESVELDSGEWVIAGEPAHESPALAAANAAPEDDRMDRWLAYRAAFANESAGGVAPTAAATDEAPERTSYVRPHTGERHE
ncbi:hypothetical protein AB0M80_21240 [Amycolatopsis sp. NPDC051045]|uniref:hypothetical protein n=1 Tax=Amycolatopsis sp. NPDC051045 TaxID=3156922 RepID=UPI0034145EE8